MRDPNFSMPLNVPENSAMNQINKAIDERNSAMSAKELLKAIPLKERFQFSHGNGKKNVKRHKSVTSKRKKVRK